MKERMGTWGRLLFEKYGGTKEVLAKLHPRENQEEMLRNLWSQRLRVLGCLLAVGIVLVLYCLFSEETEDVIQRGNSIPREDSGKTVTFGVEADTVEGRVEDRVTVTLEHREFTPEECQELEHKVDAYLKENVKGENASLQQVTMPLRLVTEVPGTQVKIQWNWDDTYMDAEGNLFHDKIPQQGVELVLSAEARWNNWEKVYDFPVVLMAKEKSPLEEFKQQISDAIESAVVEQTTKKNIQLPEMVAGYPIRYVNPEPTKDFSVLYLFLAALIAMPFLWNRQQKEELRKREEQLMLDYPEVVNKMMLLLSAGLTVRKCFERIAGEYEQRLEESGQRRYVYEEICYVCQEMSHGMTESEALEEWGKRCGQLSYLRLSSLLTQNIRKGSDGLLKILETESLDAFEKRKEAVKQMGEKAGTKLLLPMVLMLGIVMAIIVVPAFMTL